MSSSWKLDSSHAIQVSGETRPGSSESARPTLPATSTGTPPARSMAPHSSVVVVLPLVPVMPTIGFCNIRDASSTSLHTGTPSARAETTVGSESGTPGDLTNALTPTIDTASPRPTHSAPAAAILPRSTCSERSVATTRACGHTRAIASQAASPDRLSPRTMYRSVIGTS